MSAGGFPVPTEPAKDTDMTAAEKHSTEERCFYCASDSELQAALSGRPHPTIHMDSPLSACPHEAPS